jgi:hypothetical protein
MKGRLGGVRFFFALPSRRERVRVRVPMLDAKLAASYHPQRYYEFH